MSVAGSVPLTSAVIVAVVEMDLDRGRALDDVVVGDHQAVGADDEAAAAGVGPELLGLVALASLPLALVAGRAGVARTEEELEGIAAALAAAAAARAPSRWSPPEWRPPRDRPLPPDPRSWGCVVAGVLAASWVADSCGPVGRHAGHRQLQPPGEDHAEDDRADDEQERGELTFTELCS